MRLGKLSGPTIQNATICHRMAACISARVRLSDLLVAADLRRWIINLRSKCLPLSGPLRWSILSSASSADFAAASRLRPASPKGRNRLRISQRIGLKGGGSRLSRSWQMLWGKSRWRQLPIHQSVCRKSSMRHSPRSGLRGVPVSRCYHH